MNEKSEIKDKEDKNKEKTASVSKDSPKSEKEKKSKSKKETAGPTTKEKLAKKSALESETREEELSRAKTTKEEPSEKEETPTKKNNLRDKKSDESLEEKLDDLPEKIIEEKPYFDIFTNKYSQFQNLPKGYMSSFAGAYSPGLDHSQLYAYLSQPSKIEERHLESDVDAIARMVMSGDSENIFEQGYSRDNVLDVIRAAKLARVYGIDNYVNPLKKTAHKGWAMGAGVSSETDYEMCNV